MTHLPDESRPWELLTRDDVAYAIRARRRRDRSLARLKWLRKLLLGAWSGIRWLIKEGVPTGALIVAGIAAWRSGEIAKLIALFT